MDMPLRFLVVDDDPTIRRYLKCLLERKGYEVSTAANGGEALDRARVGTFDFVLTDWMMPELDGLELCRRIRHMPLPEYVYVIMLTARSNSADAIAALESGADDFISKPIDCDLLFARIKSGIRVLTLERNLRRQCRRDALTGAWNRGTLDEAMATEWDRSVRYDYLFSCVMIDLDGFKQVNDAHGHLVGDQVLRQVANLLVGEIRSTDDLARYGGDEFVLVLTQTSLEGAAGVAERCRKAIADTCFPVEGVEGGVKITASFGVASQSMNVTSHTHLLDLADQALLRAKQSGRDRVEVDATDAADHVSGITTPS